MRLTKFEILIPTDSGWYMQLTKSIQQQLSWCIFVPCAVIDWCCCRTRMWYLYRATVVQILLESEHHHQVVVGTYILGMSDGDW